MNYYGIVWFVDWMLKGQIVRNYFVCFKEFLGTEKLKQKTYNFEGKEKI